MWSNMSFNPDALRRPGAARLGAFRRRLTLRYGLAVLRALSVTLCIASAMPALAEIERIAIPNEKGMSFYWWPKLPPVAGWQQDREFSIRYSFNAFAPSGQSFASAETVMYAKALYKPRIPQVKSLEMLIEDERRDFTKNVPGVMIREAQPLVTGDGRKAVSFTFTPQTQGNWERVAYLDEKEFYLIFAISSRTAQGLAAHEKSYEGLVLQYRETP